MKQLIIQVLALLLGWGLLPGLYGQSPSESTGQQPVIRLAGSVLDLSPIVVLKVKGYQLETRQQQTENPIISSILPEWIKSIEVYRNTGIAHSAGEAGKDGIVILTLKSRMWHKLPLLLREQFKHSDYTEPYTGK